MIYLLIFSIIILIISIILFVKTHRINVEVDKTNLQLEEKQKELILNNNKISEKIISKQDQLTTISKLINQEQEQLKNIQDNIQITLDNNKKLSLDAFNSWWDNLEKSYVNKEQEFDENVQKMKDKSEKEVAQIQQDLDKIRQTRAAAIQASLREKEIKEKLSFYCLKVQPAELADIKKLEAIKPQLNNPRILSMLIWSTYFQKPMTNLCNNVIGTSVKSGIYKITNQLNDMCYIGQAVDLATRWKNHAKAGLGIDTPVNNPLYKSMIEDGIWNFSFEVLEECSREELNEKEKYYIQLYQSKEFGYNTLSGINKT